MRRDIEAPALAKLAHPGQVVFERVVLEHRQRKGQVPAQHAPTLAPGLLKRHGAQVLRIAFAGPIELHHWLHSW